MPAITFACNFYHMCWYCLAPLQAASSTVWFMLGDITCCGLNESEQRPISRPFAQADQGLWLLPKDPLSWSKIALGILKIRRSDVRSYGAPRAPH